MEKDLDEYLEKSAPLPQGKVVGTPQSPQPNHGNLDDDGVNWLGKAATLQNLKETLVIAACVGLLVWLMCILTSLVNAIVEIFKNAVNLYSAPIAVVKTMDWHVLGLGVSLVVGVSAISIILMKSVFGSNNKKTSDGLNLTDMPIGEFLTSIKDLIKK